jgi:3-oxoacyl-[acyl-carrier-protein] synthase-3
MTKSTTPHLRNPRSKATPRSVHIVGTGSYVPDRVMTNADLEKLVDTTDEWIVTRSGIRERRIAPDHMCTSDMAAEAARRAMEQAGVRETEIDLIICATITPDMPFPATACLIQQKIGAKNAAAFDMEAACSGFLYGLEIGQNFITSGTFDTVLVIGAEKLSTIVDWQDRATCVLFGDGAGAVVLEPAPAGEGILQVDWRTDGEYADMICMPGGGCRYPPWSHESIDQRLPFIKMRGNETFKVAVRALTELSLSVLESAGMKPEDLDLFIPHQANIRILQAVGSRLGLGEDKVFTNVQHTGNTSAASIPLAMADAVAEGRLTRGSLVLASAFGGGLTCASMLFRY